MQVKQLLDLHKKQLRGIIELRGVRRMQKIYSESQVELANRLHAMEKAGRGQAFQAHHMRQVLLQVHAGVKEFEGKLGEHLASTGRLAVTLAPRHLTSMVKKLNEHFTGSSPVLQVDQAAVFQRMVKDVEPSLLNRYKRSTKLYGVPVVKKIREELSFALIQGQSVDEAIDRVSGASGIFDGERWRVERIVRTELSYSYGVSNQRAMQELAKNVPKLQKRLVATIDSRTGEDSIELNGQTVDFDQPFVWEVKNSKGVPTGKVVNYMQPPNRPNDREVVIPWQPGWS